MGPILYRRTVLIGIAATGFTTTVWRGPSNLGPFHEYFLGPMPLLPPLPPTPYPYRRPVLWTDGHVSYIDGFVCAVWTQQWIAARIALEVPYGIPVTTNAEKLWLLGKPDFAPRHTPDIREQILKWQRLQSKLRGDPTLKEMLIAYGFREIRSGVFVS